MSYDNPPPSPQDPYGQRPGSYPNPSGYQQPGYPPTGYGPGYGPPSHPGTNGMAIASLVLGIIWLYWIGSVLALIFGYVAKNQIRETGQAGAGMATAGIVLGWVGVGFFVLALMLGLAVGW